MGHYSYKVQDVKSDFYQSAPTKIFILHFLQPPQVVLPGNGNGFHGHFFQPTVPFQGTVLREANIKYLISIICTFNPTCHVLLNRYIHNIRTTYEENGAKKTGRFLVWFVNLSALTKKYLH